MHAASGLFSWIMELLALASRPFAPKMLDHLMVAGTAVVVEHPFGEYRKYNLSSIVAYSYQVPGMHVAEDVTAYHLSLIHI